MAHGELSRIPIHSSAKTTSPQEFCDNDHNCSAVVLQPSTKFCWLKFSTPNCKYKAGYFLRWRGLYTLFIHMPVHNTALWEHFHCECSIAGSRMNYPRGVAIADYYCEATEAISSPSAANYEECEFKCDLELVCGSVIFYADINTCYMRGSTNWDSCHINSLRHTTYMKSRKLEN